MEILILGTGDAFSRLHYGSSAALRAPVESGGGVMLIDCPDPIHRVLHEAGAKAGGPWSNLRADAVTDILLTHLHGDHSNGLESLGFYHRLLRLKCESEGRPAAPTPRLWTSQQAGAQVWQKLAPAMAGALGRSLADFYDLRLLTPGQTAEVAGFKIESRVTTHPLHCLGLRITDPAGAMLGWAGDTGFEQAHLDWLAPAQMIVHEANEPPAHTDIRELAKQPEAFKTKLRLLHLPDDFDASPYGLIGLQDGDVLRL